MGDVSENYILQLTEGNFLVSTRCYSTLIENVCESIRMASCQVLKIDINCNFNNNIINSHSKIIHIIFQQTI